MQHLPVTSSYATKLAKGLQILRHSRGESAKTGRLAAVKLAAVKLGGDLRPVILEPVTVEPLTIASNRPPGP